MPFTEVLSSGISEGSTEVVSKSFSTVFDAAYQEISSCCNWVFDLIKFDVFINFFQEMGLWFKNFKFPQIFSDMFHGFMDFVSLVWDFVLGITDLHIFYAWSSISVLFFTIWLIQKIYDPQPEIKGPNTYSWEHRGKLWYYWTYGLVTILSTLYLPTITSVFNVLFCYPGFMIPYELTCYSGKHWIHFGVALFVFLYNGLCFPYQTFLVINRYQPKPHKYDENGLLIDQKYDKEKFIEQYRDILSRDTCPYNFLYSGYEYGWSLYKVITMIIKVMLIIPTVPFITSSIGSASTTLVIVTVYGLISLISSPFLLPQDDWMDITSRVTAVCTIIIEILVIKDVIYDPWSSYALIALNIVNLVVLIGIVVFNLEFVKNFFRKHFGKLKLKSGLAYDLANDRKQRIWQRFWRGFFSGNETLAPCQARLIELHDVYTKLGAHAFKASLIAPTPQIAQARRMVQFLEGPDVYFKGNTPDKTYWGKLFITSFPFECNIVYDESGQIVTVNKQQVIDLFEQNFKDKEIVLARKFRQMLRCLNNERVYYKFTDIMPIRSGCSKVEAEVRFSSGIFHLETKAPDPFAEGFRCTLELDDGVATVGGERITGIKRTIGHEELGIRPDFGQTPELNALFLEPSNKALVTAKWPDMIERRKWMREDLEEERREKEDILSTPFYLSVFCNHRIPKEDLISYIMNFEQNEVLHSAIEANMKDIEALYSRLRYYDAHPAVAFWYNFFDDVSLRNHMLKGIERRPDLFDVSRATALAFHPMAIDKLKERLVEEGLRTKRGGGLFNDKVMDEFERRLEEESMGQPVEVPSVSIEEMSEYLTADTLCLSTPLITENTTYVATAAMMAFTG